MNGLQGTSERDRRRLALAAGVFQRLARALGVPVAELLE